MSFVNVGWFAHIKTETEARAPKCVLTSCYNTQTKGMLMKTLVIENDLKEFALIQQAFDPGKETLIQLASCEQAWPYLQSGEARFVIANWDTADLFHSQFISRVRSAKFIPPVYILLTTLKNTDDDVIPPGADDMIQRPFKTRDFKNRVHMAQRIVSLSSNLAVVHDQLAHQALFDNLTGFMNRAAFFKQAAGELERARRASMPISLIALDIDNFAAINNEFGIDMGNQVLRIVARAIREKSRPYDCIGRWAGDEFVLMLSGAIGADAEKVTERIIAGVRGTHIAVQNGDTLNVKISAGVASVARISTSIELEPLIHQSLQAMKRAKEAGGNQIFLVYT